jgi:hypothetical protein
MRTAEEISSATGPILDRLGDGLKLGRIGAGGVILRLRDR